MRWLRYALGAALAIGGARGAIAQPSPTEPATRAIVCGKDRGLTARMRGPIAATWDHRRTTGGQGEVELRWCGRGALTDVEVSLGDGAATSTTVALTRGHVLVIAVTGRASPGRERVAITAHDAAGRVHRATAIVVSIDAPARVAARAACEACEGRWERTGVSMVEQCACAAPDAGARCTSDADCAGPCTLAGWEPSDGAPCPEGQRRERAFGRCAARVDRAGCVAWDAPLTRCAAPASARRREP